nr:hypothetical protein [Tanacetum cinerariifolium]
MAGGHDDIMTTQEYVRKVNEDVSEDDHFMLGAWLSAIVYLHGEGKMASGCLGDMKKYCINGKLEIVVGVVMSCTSTALEDMTVTLKDPTGVMRVEKPICLRTSKSQVYGYLMRFLALGWLLEEKHATWAHLEKKRTRLWTYTKSHEDICKQWRRHRKHKVTSS